MIAMQEAPTSKEEFAGLTDQQADRDLRKRLVVELAVIVVVFGGFGAWSATTVLSGAIIAPGSIVVENNSKKVEHPSGGTVGAILVHNGDRVKAGDVLVRLDDTQARSSLAIIDSQLRELTARKARLTAERDGLEAVEFPRGFEEASAEAKPIAAGERRLFAARRESAASRRRQLEEQIGELEQEIRGLKGQVDAKAEELALISDDLQRLDKLFKKGLTEINRVIVARREKARTGGEHGMLVSQIARARGLIAEKIIEITQIDEERSSEAQKEIRDIEAQVAELHERRIAADDVLRLIEPQGAPGRHRQRARHPHRRRRYARRRSRDDHRAERRSAGGRGPYIADRHRPGVHRRQQAVLRFAAFNQQTTPDSLRRRFHMSPPMWRAIPRPA